MVHLKLMVSKQAKGRIMKFVPTSETLDRN